MYTRPNALASYGKMANAETNPLKQIVMLYDGAIKFLHLTAADIENGDLIAKAEHSNRAFDILNYLQSILDFERGGESAVILDNLYSSISVLVLRASAELDPKLMRFAADLLMPVRDAWNTNAQNSVAAQVPPPMALGNSAAAATTSIKMSA